MNRIFSSNNKWALLKATQACVLGASLMCSQVFAHSISDLLEQLQAPGSEVRLNALESKEMHGCFFSDDDYECSWTREEYDRVLGVVIRLASDRHPRIRESVARYMSISTDARTLAPLAHMLMDPDAGVRRVAVGVFITTGVNDPVNVPAHVRKKIIRQLENLLEDTDPAIRGYAASALVQNGTPQSLQDRKSVV